MVPLRSLSKVLLSICCFFHDQVHRAPEKKGDDNTSIIICEASQFAPLLPLWPGNGSSREYCRCHLERSPGMDSCNLSSLQ